MDSWWSFISFQRVLDSINTYIMFPLLTEVIKINKNYFFNRSKFQQLLHLATKESHFFSMKNGFNQVDELAMHSLFLFSTDFHFHFLYYCRKYKRQQNVLSWYRLSVNKTNLQTLSTPNKLLVELIPSLTVSYHPPRN